MVNRFLEKQTEWTRLTGLKHKFCVFCFWTETMVGIYNLIYNISKDWKQRIA